MLTCRVSCIFPILLTQSQIRFAAKYAVEKTGGAVASFLEIIQFIVSVQFQHSWRSIASA